ncbi:MAG: DsrE family protein [Candidatus Rokubacteria bacterium]|nr:DsrE family protein [Candidatus Rokubacteria bacterium]
MRGRWMGWLVAAGIVASALAAEPSIGEASHKGDNPKKHKIFYHFNEADPKKASAVLTNIQNHIDVVGWKNIEDLVLVAHGPGLTPFLRKTMDPEVKGKLDRLLTGGLSFAACEITMQRRSIKVEELAEGVGTTPSGVVRVMELQEKGYAYIRP